MLDEKAWALKYNILVRTESVHSKLLHVWLTSECSIQGRKNSRNAEKLIWKLSSFSFTFNFSRASQFYLMRGSQLLGCYLKLPEMTYCTLLEHEIFSFFVFAQQTCRWSLAMYPPSKWTSCFCPCWQELKAGLKFNWWNKSSNDMKVDEVYFSKKMS